MAPNPNPNGRRPRRMENEQLRADVVLGLMSGLPLAVICRRNGVSQKTVSKWEARDPVFADQIAAARALGWDSLAVECLEIADDSRNDYVEQFTDEGESQGWRLNPEAVQRSKLRIETRLKLLACWDTGRYGPQRTVKVEGEVTQTTRHVLDPRSLDDAGRAALRALIEHAKAQGLLEAPEPQDAEFEEVGDDEELAP